MFQILPGTTIKNRYVVKRRLGEGGMALVYEAFDPRLNRDFALKVLPPHLAADPGFLARFEQEGAALAALNHPNILRLFTSDQDEDAGLYFLVLEYLTGGSLKARIHNGSPWAPPSAIRLLHPVAAALDYAHRGPKPVIHRDLKPANILFGDDDRVVVSDFGLARIMAPEPSDAGSAEQGPISLYSGELLGTPEYMSPEQAEGRALGPTTDIYSLGVIAYELLVGRVPFRADTPQATLIQVASKPLPLPTHLNPELDSYVEHVLLKALARDPANRFATAEAFIDALASAAQDSVRLQRRYTLEIKGSPAEAEVVIDGVAAGRLPCSVAGLEKGFHKVEVRAEGYRPQILDASVPTRAPVEIELEPETYEVTIRGTPDGASVAVDGQQAGQLPSALVVLRAGPHELQVEHSGWLPLTLPFMVPDDTDFSIELGPQTYQLAIEGEPAGAEIAIDGQPAGTLPCRIEGLLAGEHEVVATYPRHQRMSERVRVPDVPRLTISLPQEQPVPAARDVTRSILVRAGLIRLFVAALVVAAGVGGVWFVRGLQAEAQQRERVSASATVEARRAAEFAAAAATATTEAAQVATAEVVAAQATAGAVAQATTEAVAAQATAEAIAAAATAEAIAAQATADALAAAAASQRAAVPPRVAPPVAPAAPAARRPDPTATKVPPRFPI